jgi:anthranilate synthase component 1
MENSAKLNIRPSAAAVRDILSAIPSGAERPTKIPICASLPSDLLTPTAIYLKLSKGATADYSFLLESATGSTETVGRYSYVGTKPRKVIRTGEGHDAGATDPLPVLQAELARGRVASVPSLKLPPLSGGAVGYIGYDCVRYFEPKTDRPLSDKLHIPEALFMLYDTIVAVDHFTSTLTIITHVELGEEGESVNDVDVDKAYDEACTSLRETLAIVQKPETPHPPQPDLDPAPEGGPTFTSNVGRSGYEGFVTELKKHVQAGNIIQAVPSQRFARETKLHPFNIYRTLRTVNPSPYLFFLCCADFYIVGASPECLMKTDGYVTLPPDARFGYSASEVRDRPRIVNHAIAGTVARGATAAEDDELARQLQNSTKDRAEHVMLVDLARNDVNRVCHPTTVQVDRLMGIDRFSHVQHLTSHVSGVLRPECSRWDALRSTFPAGTVSGAPKVRAMELIYDLEKEKRGIYAGAAGWFAYDVVKQEQQSQSQQPVSSRVIDGQMDVCIAIRTMLIKDGVAYMQSGGGIVFDSNEEEEWLETMNKGAANMRCIELAESYFAGGPEPRSVAQIIALERQKGCNQTTS